VAVVDILITQLECRRGRGCRDLISKKDYALVVCPQSSEHFCILSRDFGKQIYGNILTSDNILSIPSVDVIVHISSVIAIVVVSSIVHHVRPGILVVRITAAYVHHITRSHVDARNQRNSEHLHGGGVVQDLIDHHPLQVAVNLGDTLHGTGAPDKRFALRLGSSVRSVVVVNLRSPGWLLLGTWLLLRTRLLLRLVWPWVGFHLVNFRSLFMNFWFLLNFLGWLLVLLSGGFRDWHSLGGPRVGRRSRRPGPSPLTHVGASVKAAEGVIEAVHVRLSHTPAVRHST